MVIEKSVKVFWHVIVNIDGYFRDVKPEANKDLIAHQRHQTYIEYQDYTGHNFIHTE